MNKTTIKRFSIAVVAVFILAITVFAWFSQRFEINASADTLLLKENQHYLQTQIANERYSPAEFILIAYEPKSGEIFSNEELRRLLEIAEDIQTIERVKNVRSIATVPMFSQLSKFQGDLNLEGLTWQQQRYAPEEMEASLTNHPLYDGLLVNEQRTALGLQVVFAKNKELETLDSRILDIRRNLLERDLTDKEKQKIKRLTEQRDKLRKEMSRVREKEIEIIRRTLQPFKQYGQFYLGGNNLLAYQLIKIIKSDLVVFGIAIACIITLLLTIIFRRLKWVVLPLACCSASVIMTLGLLGLLGLKVTVISANVIALQIILSLAVIIHLVVQYQELADNNSDLSHEELALNTVKQKIKPCFYAGITTAIGFGSLIFSGVQPVISFGWMMVVAMLVTLTVSLLLFPALLVVGFSFTEVVKKPTFIQNAVSWMAEKARRSGKTIVVSSIAVTAIGLGGCFFLSAENSFLNYFKKSTEVYKELSYIDQKFGGSTPLDILYDFKFDKEDETLVVGAEHIQTLEKIQNKLSEYEAVGNITSIADFTRIAQAINGKPLTEYELTAVYNSMDKSQIEQYFGNYFSAEHNQLRVSTRIKDSTPNLDRNQLLINLKSDIKGIGLESEQFKLTNLFVLYEDVLSRLLKSQVMTLGIVYLAMAVVLVVIFSSLKIAIIALVPNVITTAIVLGTMGWAGIPLDLMTITIAAVAMGISVDDTIHYVHRYLEENKNKSDGAIQRTNSSVGYALIYTTLIIVIGFSALMFSDFVPSLLFGGLTGMAMFVALLTDLTILPVLLKRFINPRSEEEQINQDEVYSSP